MSDTEPGLRVMPGSTLDSCVPGASSGVSLWVLVRYQPSPPPIAPTSRTASRPSTTSRIDRSRSRSFLRPLASTTTGPVLGVLVVDGGRAEAGRRVRVAPRVAAGVGLPPRPGRGAAAVRGGRSGGSCRPADAGGRRPEGAQQRLGGRRRQRARRRRRPVAGEGAVDGVRATEGGLLAGRRLRAGDGPWRVSRTGASSKPVGRRGAGEDGVAVPAACVPGPTAPARRTGGRRRCSGGPARSQRGRCSCRR